MVNLWQNCLKYEIHKTCASWEKLCSITFEICATELYFCMTNISNIFQVIIIDKLEPRTHYRQPLFPELKYSENAKYPENYQSCANFGWLIGRAFQLLGE